MDNYVITCESGAVALVDAESIDEANDSWDRDVEAGKAEPRISGTTRVADEDDIESCVANGHDYRTGEGYYPCAACGGEGTIDSGEHGTCECSACDGTGEAQDD